MRAFEILNNPPLIEEYVAKSGEANFASPISKQVSGGTHITFEIVTKKGNDFYMVRWPEGLPGHDDPDNSLRFPHGLIMFGETVEKCASRLVKEQLGMNVKEVIVVEIDSYVDDDNHWHIEPLCFAKISGSPDLPKEASEVVTFKSDDPPKMTFWAAKDFEEFVEKYGDRMNKK